MCLIFLWKNLFDNHQSILDNPGRPNILFNNPDNLPEHIFPIDQEILNSLIVPQWNTQAFKSWHCQAEFNFRQILSIRICLKRFDNSLIILHKEGRALNPLNESLIDFIEAKDFVKCAQLLVGLDFVNHIGK